MGIADLNSFEKIRKINYARKKGQTNTDTSQDEKSRATAKAQRFFQLRIRDRGLGETAKGKTDHQHGGK